MRSVDLLALADHSQFDFQSMTFAVPLQPGSADAGVIPQWSSDLQHWNEDRDGSFETVCDSC
jgi:hypothetical protein